MAVPTGDQLYKAGVAGEYRFGVNIDETLQQFKEKFANGDIFKSASEICDLFIVPNDGTTLSNMDGFWSNHRRTGENARERIYTTIYPRLTTRSNTYTVHFRVQALKKQRTSTSGTWTEGKDLITGEYRGATVIERFINPDAEIPNYAKNPDSISTFKTLDQFYKWRTIRNTQFNP